MYYYCNNFQVRVVQSMLAIRKRTRNQMPKSECTEYEKSGVHPARSLSIASKTVATIVTRYHAVTGIDRRRNGALQ
jgi:hypothetical protein